MPLPARPSAGARRSKRESFRRLSTIVQASMDAVIVTDAAGLILLFNHAAERVFRCQASKAIGQPIGRLIPPQHLTRLEEDVGGRVGSGSAGKTAVAHERVQATRADGETFPALATIAHSRDRSGERALVVRDMTEWEWTADRLRKLSQAVDETATGICITDLHGVIQYVNSAFEGMVGYPRGELVGRTPRLFRSGQHDPAFYQRLWNTLLAGEVFHHVFVDRNAVGELIHLDETITPLRDSDKKISDFVVIARDVTTLVRTEEALRRLIESREEQAKWIAQTLHDEAGQYLTAAYIALVEAGRDLGPDGRKRLRDVKKHLDRVEDQLRRLAHELHPQILDDVGLVPAIEFLAEGMSKRRGIAVGVKAALQSQLQPVVESTVYRVVQEALTNVSKHARATRATIRITEDPYELSCSIKDDGVGFDVATVLRGAPTRGLGLKGIRDRLEALGGALDITSDRGRGTELRVTIPMGN